MINHQASVQGFTRATSLLSIDPLFKCTPEFLSDVFRPWMHKFVQVQGVEFGCEIAESDGSVLAWWCEEQAPTEAIVQSITSSNHLPLVPNSSINHLANFKATLDGISDTPERQKSGSFFRSVCCFWRKNPESDALSPKYGTATWGDKITFKWRHDNPMVGAASELADAMFSETKAENSSKLIVRMSRQTVVKVFEGGEDGGRMVLMRLRPVLGLDYKFIAMMVDGIINNPAPLNEDHEDPVQRDLLGWLETFEMTPRSRVEKLSNMFQRLLWWIVAGALIIGVISSSLATILAMMFFRAWKFIFETERSLSKRYSRYKSDVEKAVAARHQAFATFFKDNKLQLIGKARAQNLSQVQVLKRRMLVTGSRLNQVHYHTGLGVGVGSDQTELGLRQTAAKMVQGVQELYNTHVTGLLDMLYSSFSVVLVIYAARFQLSGLCTVVSVLNTVMLAEESSGIAQYASRIWLDGPYEFGSLLLKLQAHVAVPAVMDIFQATNVEIRTVFAIGYGVCMIFIQCAIAYLEFNSTTNAVFNLISSYVNIKGLIFSERALLIWLAEKTGNFWMILPSD